MHIFTEYTKVRCVNWCSVGMMGAVQDADLHDSTTPHGPIARKSSTRSTIVASNAQQMGKAPLLASKLDDKGPQEHTEGATDPDFWSAQTSVTARSKAAALS